VDDHPSGLRLGFELDARELLRRRTATWPNWNEYTGSLILVAKTKWPRTLGSTNPTTDASADDDEYV
jgi:hypothetical protein